MLKRVPFLSPARPDLKGLLDPQGPTWQATQSATHPSWLWRCDVRSPCCETAPSVNRNPPAMLDERHGAAPHDAYVTSVAIRFSLTDRIMLRSPRSCAELKCGSATPTLSRVICAFQFTRSIAGVVHPYTTSIDLPPTLDACNQSHRFWSPSSARPRRAACR